MMSDDAAGMRHSKTVHHVNHSYMWQIWGTVAKTQSEREFKLMHICDLQWFICDGTADIKVLSLWGYSPSQPWGAYCLLWTSHCSSKPHGAKVVKKVIENAWIWSHAVVLHPSLKQMTAETKLNFRITMQETSVQNPIKCHCGLILMLLQWNSLWFLLILEGRLSWVLLRCCWKCNWKADFWKTSDLTDIIQMM